MLPDSVSAFACVSTVLVPLRVIALASDSPLAAACNVVPFAKVRSPVPSALLEPTASVPALSAVPPAYKLLPESVSVPLPILVTPPARQSVPEGGSAFGGVSTVRVPLRVIALARESPLAAACSVVPLAKVSVPVPSAVLDPTATVPTLIVVPPAYKLPPDSVRVPAPTLLTP